MEPKKLSDLFNQYAQLAAELADMEFEMVLAFRQAMRDGVSPETMAEITKGFMLETARFMPLIQGLVALDKLSFAAAEAIKEARMREELQSTSCADCPLLGVCNEPAADKYRGKERTN